MQSTLARSYSYCQRLARREAGNFFHAFLLLPLPQRLAMSALYAFLRVTDDLSDGRGSTEKKRAKLKAWRGQLDAALQGDFQHPLHQAFVHTVRTYDIPREYLDGVLAGVAMDLEPVCYRTFEELYPYCYRVASTVGLSCLHIWGFEEDKAKLYAERAGIAFQLTNILRDLGEDAARGRCYLPVEELERFGYSGQELCHGERNGVFRALMQFQVARARGFYETAQPLTELLEPAGRAVFLVMARTYRSLLEKIEACDYDVFSRRVRVSGWRKLGHVLSAMPVRLGIVKGAW